MQKSNKRKELLFYYGVVLWAVLFFILIIFQDWHTIWIIGRCLLESFVWAGCACIVIVMAIIFFEDIQKHRNAKNILFGLITVMLLGLYYAAFRNFFTAGYLVANILNKIICASMGGMTYRIVEWNKK